MANFGAWPFADFDFPLLVNGHGHSPFLIIPKRRMANLYKFVDRLESTNSRIKQNSDFEFFHGYFEIEIHLNRGSFLFSVFRLINLRFQWSDFLTITYLGNPESVNGHGHSPILTSESWWMATAIRRVIKILILAIHFKIFIYSNGFFCL